VQYLSLLLALWAMAVGGLHMDKRMQGPHAMRLSFAEAERWRIDTQGPYWAHIDRRALFNIFHPLVPSETGAFAAASRRVTIPATWTPPYVLRFYCTDSYSIPDYPPPAVTDGYAEGTDDYPGHRFKQVLVNGRVVWERDVKDPADLQAPSLFQVDLTPYIVPGRPFTLTFRVFDKLTTRKRLDGDVRYLDSQGRKEEPRFCIAAWFGDPVIGEQAAVGGMDDEPRPSEAIVRRRHRRRWPLPLPGDRQQSPAGLALVAPRVMPPGGFPLVCTIPFGPGSLRDGTRLVLTDPRGRACPLQPEVMSRWPDGSVRWVLLNAVLPADARPNEQWTAAFGKQDVRQIPSVPAGLSVHRRGRVVTIDTGAVVIQLGGDRHTLVDSIVLPGAAEPLVVGVKPRMVVECEGRPQPVTASWHDLRLVRRGPVRATVELRGSLDTTTRHIGRFVFRLDAYAGLGAVGLQFRIFNHVMPQPFTETISDPPLVVRRLALDLPMPGTPRGPVRFGVEGGGAVEAPGRPATLLQGSEDSFVISGTHTRRGTHAAGWVAASTDRGAVQAVVWRFWQQYPKALEAAADGLHIHLFSPSNKMDRYRPRFGEAKRHDILLSLGPVMPSAQAQESIAANFQHPPRLFDRVWFCRSGALSLLDPHWFENQPKIAAWVADHIGDGSLDSAYMAAAGYSFGIRDFGDRPVGDPSEQRWRSDYCDRVEGAFNWALAGGSPQWFERAVEIARHVQDVDTIHLPPDCPLWKQRNGATISWGVDHSVHGGQYAINPAYQAGQALLANWWLTGDPDSLQDGLANAEYIMRNDPGYRTKRWLSPRVQTRPFWILLRAWEATGRAKYLARARKYLRLIADEFMDSHRGGYIRGVYRNWTGISAGLDSEQAAHIYEYYRLTGDLLAAQVVVARAESVYCESMLPQPQALGDFIFYPRYGRNSWYFPQMSWLFCMAYDLTGDRRFLRAARAAFDRYLLCPYYQEPGNWGWLEPELGAWFDEFADVQTEPYHVTSMVTEPDPAHFGPQPLPR